MGCTEFFRRQAEMFAKQRRVELQWVADGYEYMLHGKATDAGHDHQHDATEAAGHAYRDDRAPLANLR